MGSSGAGKTYLARALSKHLSLPHLELDAIRHQADWQPLPDREFREWVSAFCSGDAWVVDGNYAVVRDLIIERSTDVVLLDYSKRIVMTRLIMRSLWRVLLRKRLWNGNRERFQYLLSTNPELNVVLWSWINFGRRRAEFDTIAAPGLRVHRFTEVITTESLIEMIESN